MIIVSACLAGVHCKYNGGTNLNPALLTYLQEQHWVPVCPEQLGGLTTPRSPAEIQAGNGEMVLQGEARVKTADGRDVTGAFVLGAEETLRIVQLVGATEAILKEGSPSCGSCRIYDGTFGGQRIAGMGVTAALLQKHGVTVRSEDSYER